MSDTQSSLGSSELEIHTEQAFSNLRPDIISPECLRGDPNAYTHLLPVERVIENTSRKEIELLHEPLWKIGVDLSFRSSIDDMVRGPIPILHKAGSFVFDQDLMTGTTPEATELIHKIVDIYYRHRTSICLEPGDILLIDNNSNNTIPYKEQQQQLQTIIRKIVIVMDAYMHNKSPTPSITSHL